MFCFSCYRRAYAFAIQSSALAASEYAVLLAIAALIAIGAAATMGTDVAHTVNTIGDMLDNNHFRVEH